MKAAIIFLLTIVSLPALATERVTATWVGSNVYKLDNGRVAITTGCSVAGVSDAVLNDDEDTLTFIDDEEECAVKSIH